MIFLTVLYVDGLLTTAGLFTTVMGFASFLLGQTPNTLGLLMLGGLTYATVYRALGLHEKLIRIIEGG